MSDTLHILGTVPSQNLFIYIQSLCITHLTCLRQFHGFYTKIMQLVSWTMALLSECDGREVNCLRGSCWGHISYREQRLAGYFCGSWRDLTIVKPALMNEDWDIAHFLSAHGMAASGYANLSPWGKRRHLPLIKRNSPNRGRDKWYRLYLALSVINRWKKNEVKPSKMFVSVLCSYSGRTSVSQQEKM